MTLKEQPEVFNEAIRFFFSFFLLLSLFLFLILFILWRVAVKPWQGQDSKAALLYCIPGGGSHGCITAGMQPSSQCLASNWRPNEFLFLKMGVVQNVTHSDGGHELEDGPGVRCRSKLVENAERAC